jgi:hypothetical protein
MSALNAVIHSAIGLNLSSLRRNAHFAHRRSAAARRHGLSFSAGAAIYKDVTQALK